MNIFEKISENDKPLTKLCKMWKENIQIKKIRNEVGDVTTDIKEFQRNIRACFKDLYSTKLQNLKDVSNFNIYTTYIS